MDMSQLKRLSPYLNSSFNSQAWVTLPVETQPLMLMLSNLTGYPLRRTYPVPK